jgi:hypothetical protein
MKEHPTEEQVVKTREALEAEAAHIRDQLDAIDTQERLAMHRSLVGKCFRYRNSYSCPKDESDRWWLYQRIIEIDRRGWLRVFMFQRDRDGKLEIETALSFGTSALGEPITLRQFQYAWKVTARMVNDAARAAGAVR